MDLTKEELLGSIQRLHKQRKQMAAEVSAAREELANRNDDLPAWGELQTASQAVKLAASKLNDQRDNDEEWQRRYQIVRDLGADLDAVEESLSEMLTLYMIKTKKKHVHAEPSDESSTDREIKVVAKLGRKVPNNTSLFDQDTEEES